MLLRVWREERGWSLAKAAAELGIKGTSPAETLRRWETGESRPDADRIHDIEVVSRGAVTATDHHATRLAWLTDRAGRTKEDGSICDVVGHVPSTPRETVAENRISHVNTPATALQNGAGR